MDDNPQPLLITPEVLGRGIIRCRDAARQVRDFSGLRYGTITPSDIDAIIEFGDKLFVQIELKYDQTPLMVGQALLFQRIVKRITAGGAPSITIVASHKTPPEKDIDVAMAEVRQFFTRSAWEKPDRPMTVRQMIDHVLVANDLGHYISRQ